MNGDGEMYHKFWYKHDGDCEDRLRDVIAMKEFLEELPETTLKFHMAHNKIPDRISVAGHFTESMEYMCGIWKIPDMYLPNYRTNYYVNPGYVYVSNYPKIYVKCECGAVFSRQQDDQFENGLRDGSNHNEDCCELYRMNARSMLMNKRSREIKKCFLYNVPLKNVFPRVGLSREATRLNVRRYGIDRERLREEYRIKAATTYMKMLNDGVDRDLIAEAYGHAPATFGRWCRNKLDAEYDFSTKKWRVNQSPSKVRMVVGD